ncbi:MAG: hypothetical protein E4H31_03090 [Dehalococcoidia bacterium]|nr:MAG: hypothetical protein E4H31_03090 [Dehalococcoidia bacterium]
MDLQFTAKPTSMGEVIGHMFNLPPLSGGIGGGTHPQILKGVTASGRCKCVGDDKCGGGKIYEVCFNTQKDCKKAQKDLDDICNNNNEMKAKCTRPKCYYRHGKPTCPDNCEPGTIIPMFSPLMIVSETKFSAPDGSANTRTDVGVGENVTFKGSVAGNWTATDGTPRILDNNNEFSWTAPNRAATVTIKLTVGNNEESILMNVIEPDGITATKKNEISYPAGTQGAGMKLIFNYHPKKISFGNVEAKEVSGPASDIRGYYKMHGMPHYHNSGDTFFSIGEDNKLKNAEDTAAQSGYPKDWSDGRFEWIIPNKFQVKTEGGDGKKFTKVTQAFSIDGTGKTRITKAGESVERSP